MQTKIDTAQQELQHTTTQYNQQLEKEQPKMKKPGH